MLFDEDEIRDESDPSQCVGCFGCDVFIISLTVFHILDEFRHFVNLCLRHLISSFFIKISLYGNSPRTFMVWRRPIGGRTRTIFEALLASERRRHSRVEAH